MNTLRDNTFWSLRAVSSRITSPNVIAFVFLLAILAYGFHVHQQFPATWQASAQVSEATPESTVIPEAQEDPYAAERLRIQTDEYNRILMMPDEATLLNLTQKSPTTDAEITLIWAYIDGNDVYVAWDYSYPETYANSWVKTISVIFPSSEKVIPSTYGEGSMGSRGWPDGLNRAYGMFMWNANEIPLDSQSVELTFVFDITANQDSTSSKPKIPPFEARFDVILPYMPPLLGSTEPILVETSGIAISLNNIRHSPLSIRGEICLPTGISTYYVPVFSIANATDFLYGRTSDFRLSEDGTTECYDFRLGVPYGITRFNNLILHIIKLQAIQSDYSPARFLAFSTAVKATWGLDIILNEGGIGYRVNPNQTMPAPSIEIYQAIQRLETEMLVDVIEDNWFFVIPMSRGS